MTQAKAKSNSVVTTVWQGDILQVEVLGIGQLLFDRTKASTANRDHAEKHGWTQRHCDKAAKAAPVRFAGQSEADWAAAKRAFVQSKFDAIEASIKHYEQGEVSWKMSGGASEGGMLFEALVEMYEGKKSREQVKSFLDSRSEEQLKVVRKIPALVVIMNRLRLERTAPVDMGAALGDLDAMGGDEEAGLTVDQEISDLMADE